MPTILYACKKCNVVQASPRIDDGAMWCPVCDSHRGAVPIPSITEALATHERMEDYQKHINSGAEGHPWDGSD